MTYVISQKTRKEINSARQYLDCRKILSGKWTDLYLNRYKVISALDAARYVYRYESGIICGSAINKEGKVEFEGRLYTPLLLGSFEKGRGDFGPEDSLQKYIYCKYRLQTTVVAGAIGDSQIGHRSILFGGPADWRINVLDAARYALEYERNNSEPIGHWQIFEPIFSSWKTNNGIALEAGRSGNPLTEGVT